MLIVLLVFLIRLLSVHPQSECNDFNRFQTMIRFRAETNERLPLLLSDSTLVCLIAIITR